MVKKKGLIVGFLIVLAVSSYFLMAKEEINIGPKVGMWARDIDGTIKGCVDGGNECVYAQIDPDL